MSKRGWVYSGDVNLEYGGVFYKIDPADWDRYDYCTAVRVDPCSDAGGPDNCWWVEELTVTRPKGDKLKDVLSVDSYSLTEDGNHVKVGDDVINIYTPQGRRIIAECCVAYGLYDKDRGITIQIGAKQSDCKEKVTPDEILRGNSKLENYVKREWLK